MGDLLILFIAVGAGSLLSLLGGIYLLYGKWGTQKIQRIAVPFAAGALLAAAFLDLLPEAIEASSAANVGVVVLLGFVGFFVLERSLGWFHHHHEDEAGGNRKSTLSLIVIGDTTHNFIDGLAIGAAFLVSPAIGIVTTIAIAAHELPQEIGDFGLMSAKGMKRKKILWVNIISSIATLIGAVLVYSLGDVFTGSIGILLAVTAGFFIYIAASDIVPTIHAEPERTVANMQTLVLIFGIVFVGAVSNIMHSYISGGHDHEAETHQTADPHAEHEEPSHEPEGSHAH